MSNLTVKYQSRVETTTADGIQTSISYQGDRSSIETFAADLVIGQGTPGIFGTLRSKTVRQNEGYVWVCELQYQADNNGGGITSPEDFSYGQKSAQLRGGVLSIPLENHPNYRTKWNHYLFARSSALAVPAWWDTAVDTILTDAQRGDYEWAKSLSDAPMFNGARGVRLREPTKRGVDSFDVKTYTIVESAKFTSAAAAANMVANKLNKIGTPVSKLSITGGNWKCDDATVSWTGKYWLATLTWTRSGDNNGWDTDLYSNA